MGEISVEQWDGHHFYIEFMNKISSWYWFRIHTNTGTRNITIEHDGNMDEAKKEVIESFKDYLIEHQ